MARDLQGTACCSAIALQSHRVGVNSMGERENKQSLGSGPELNKGIESTWVTSQGSLRLGRDARAKLFTARFIVIIDITCGFVSLGKVQCTLHA